jgi:Ca2+-binding RTX toxin-like protein
LSEKGKIVFPSFDDDIVKWGSNNNSNGLHNLIFAGAGNNSSGNGGLIKGSKGDDLIVGGKGDKSIRGGKGNDIIIVCEDSDPTVGVNNNILTGGAGKDQFVLSMDCSNFITDFASDYDRILIQGSGDVTYDRVSGQLSIGGVQIAQLKPGTELDINKDIELIN